MFKLGASGIWETLTISVRQAQLYLHQLFAGSPAGPKHLNRARVGISSALKPSSSSQSLKVRAL